MQRKIFNGSGYLLQSSFNRKFLYLFLILNLIIVFYKLSELVSTNTESKNFYDFMFSTFNDYFFVTYLLPLLVLILFYRILPSDKFHEYIMVKFKNRTEWFFMNIFSIFIVSFLYVVGMLLLFFLVTVTHLNFGNLFSEFAINKYHIPANVLVSMKPFPIFISNIFFIYLFIVSLGCMAFIGYMFFQNSVLSILLPLFFTIFGVISFLGKVEWLYPFSFPTHTLVDLIVYDKKGLFSIISSSLLYWGIVILVLLTLGLISVLKMDVKGEEK